MILISACLAGKNCKYSGGNNEVAAIRELLESGRAVAVCPEQFGGLPTPRKPAEICEGRVINTAGEDVTAEYIKGAEISLEICRKHGCAQAVLKANSPSCGCHGVYDGTFSHRLVDGEGIFAAMLIKEGIAVMDEKEFQQSLKETARSESL